MREATTERFDTLLHGGRVIDPAPGLDATLDVGLKDRRVAAVAAGLPRAVGRQTADVSGRLVLPGLIDTHAHVYRYVTGRFGLDACGRRAWVYLDARPLR